MLLCILLGTHVKISIKRKVRNLFLSIFFLSLLSLFLFFSFPPLLSLSLSLSLSLCFIQRRYLTSSWVFFFNIKATIAVRFCLFLLSSHTMQSVIYKVETLENFIFLFFVFKQDIYTGHKCLFALFIREN